MTKLTTNDPTRTIFRDDDGDQVMITTYGDSALVNTRNQTHDQFVALTPYDASRAAQALIGNHDFPHDDVSVTNVLGLIDLSVTDHGTARLTSDDARALACTLLAAADAYDGASDDGVRAEPVDTNARHADDGIPRCKACGTHLRWGRTFPGAKPQWLDIHSIHCSAFCSAADGAPHQP